jgi:hypothetical protein
LKLSSFAARRAEKQSQNRGQSFRLEKSFYQMIRHQSIQVGS